MENKQLIGHDLFQFLRPQQVRAISETADEVSMKAGDTIFQQGDKAEFFFIVLEGQVALRLPTRDGMGLLIDDVTPGAVFGSCICFQIEAYTLGARCTQDSKLLKIRAETLKKLMDDDPVVGYSVQLLVSGVYFKRYLATMQKLQTVFQSLPIEASPT